MLVPLSWLRDFAAFPDDLGLLKASLDDLGLVVEATTMVGEGLEDVVCARVLEVDGIEGADKIRKITVDAGGDPLVIVCGAWNFGVGDTVPLAPVGSVLPGGFAIGQRKMRGVTSNGMLCSARELGLGEDQGGLMVLTDTPGATPGRLLTEVLGIEPDVIFEFSVEGNRPDAWSVAGIARDLAARLDLACELPSAPRAGTAPTPTADLAAASIAAPEMCTSLAVTAARGVVVTESPAFIQRRLTMAGMRPINNVVDASNYVMLELGQPNHAYDLETLAGAALGVRRANPGEVLQTLDGVERTLGLAGRGLGDSGEDCVIIDGADQVIGIAGIMGGAATEITDTTTTIALEAACFAPMAIARTSKKLGLRTEASSRFERGADPAAVDLATARFFDLLALSAPGLEVCWPSVTAHGNLADATVLETSVAAIAGLLGVELGAAEIDRLLAPLGFAVEDAGSVLRIVVPSNRPDIRPMPFGVADVAEEVARTYGYARLERRFPAWSTPGALSPRQQARRQLRAALVGLGLAEAWTPTLVDPDGARLLGIEAPSVELTNPLAADERGLRQSLVPGMLAALAYNADRRNASVALFELGTVFTHPEVADQPRVARSGSGGAADVALPAEHEHLVVLSARDGDDATVAVAQLHALCRGLKVGTPNLVQPVTLGASQASLGAGLHPTRSAMVLLDGTVVGVVGEVDPQVVSAVGLDREGPRRVGIVALDLDALHPLVAAAARRGGSVPVSRFPSTDVDLAFVVENGIAAASVLDALRVGAGELLASVELFDVYRGPGVEDWSRSLAFRLRFESMDKTLTDVEVGELRTAAIAAVSALGATLR